LSKVSYLIIFVTVSALRNTDTAGKLLFMVILDSKKLARKVISELKQEVAQIKKPLRLAIVRVGGDAATDAFLRQKQKAGKELGIRVKIFKLPTDISRRVLRRQLSALVHSPKNTGLIIQLPLPAHLNTQYFLNSLLPEKDADVLSARALGQYLTGQSPIEPPVVGAVKALLKAGKISYQKKKILLVGAGRLVGRPLALWLLREDVGFRLATKNTPPSELKKLLQGADVIIKGTGEPETIKPELLKKGALLIDADQARGGIGPLTVAMLFKNLVILGKA
jgi:methylenetetrahydrofolate dehydrogenase (NADP+)/methenyltetrahydrofolate cyclohydrolase